jgi:hypothetical protein
MNKLRAVLEESKHFVEFYMNDAAMAADFSLDVRSIESESLETSFINDTSFWYEVCVARNILGERLQTVGNDGSLLLFEYYGTRWIALVEQPILGRRGYHIRCKLYTLNRLKSHVAVALVPKVFAALLGSATIQRWHLENGYLYVGSANSTWILSCLRIIPLTQPHILRTQKTASYHLDLIEKELYKIESSLSGLTEAMFQDTVYRATKQCCYTLGLHNKKMPVVTLEGVTKYALLSVLGLADSSLWAAIDASGGVADPIVFGLVADKPLDRFDSASFLYSMDQYLQMTGRS